MDMPPDPQLRALPSQTRGLQRLAHAILRNAADAEDAVQEAWRRALVRARAGEATSAGWLRGTVRNVARETLRGRTRRVRHEQGASLRPEARDTAEVVERLEAHQLLTAALQRLEEPYRTTLTWRYVQGMSAAAIARRLAAPAATVRWRVQEGLRRLREDLERESGGGGRGLSAIGFLAGQMTPTSVGGGVLAMAKGLKVSIGGGVLLVAGLLALGLGAWALWGRARDVSPPGPDAAQPLEAAHRPTLGDEPSVPVGAPELEEDEQPAVAQFVVEGRVVDGGRMPVGDAEVRFHARGVESAVAHTDAEGTYRIAVPRLALGLFNVATLEATTADARHGSVCVRCDALHRSRAPVEPIVLRSAREIGVRVLHAGQPVSAASVVVERRTHFIAWDTSAVLRSGTTDADGHFRLARPISGSVWIHAYKPGVGHATIVSRGRRDDAERELVLSARRRVRVQVVDFKTREPLRGVTVLAARNPQGEARIVLPAREPAVTDGEGWVTLGDLPTRDSLWLRAHKEGYFGPLTNGVDGLTTLVPREGGTMRLGLSPHRTLRFPIEGTAPPDGTTLRIHYEAVTPGMKAYVADGAVCIDGAEPDKSYGMEPEFVGTVEAPDGAMAEVSYMFGKLQEPVRFRENRSVRIRILRADGTPASDLDIEAGPRMQHLPALRTDADGLVEVRGLETEEVQVFLPGPEAFVIGMWDRVRIGRIELPATQDPVALTLPDEASLELRVTIDGTPQLPANYRVIESGLLVHWERIEEVAAAGILRVRRPVAEGEEWGQRWISVLGEGVLGGRVSLAGHRGGPIDVALRRSGALAVRLVPADAGDYRLGLERYDGASGEWRRARRAPEMHSNAVDDRVYDGNGVIRYVRLASGRYRVRDFRSTTVSTPAEVREGEPPAESELDLDNVVGVRGVVVFPEGWRNKGHLTIHIAIDGVERKPNWNVFDYRTPANEFSTRVPKGAEVRIRATYQGLLAREPEGVTIRAATGQRVTLHLDEPEGHVTFDLTAPEDAKVPEFVHVRLFDEEGQASGRQRLTRNGGKFTLPKAVREGAFRAVVDPGAPWQPMELSGLVAGRGTRDLGRLQLRSGGTVVVRVETPAGKKRPMIRVLAKGTFKGYAFERSVWTPPRKSGDLVLRGLPPGTAIVRIGPGRFPGNAFVTGPGEQEEPPPEIVRTVTVKADGETVIDVTLEDGD